MLESITLGFVAVLEHMDSMRVTGVFVVLMVTLFTAALITTRLGRATAFYRSAPALLTTMGILGTFLGIAIGLLEFDAKHVESSIPLLLDGLKVAFTTSIVGILLSTCLRLVQVLGRDAQRTTDTASTSGADIGNDTSLLAFLEHQSKVAEAQLIVTQQLVVQVKKFDTGLLQTLEQQHAQQLAALHGFAAQLSELGSRQLIEALESVLRDFNNNLGEQFGENFRRLDDSVAKLLLWQDQYREHMESLGQQLDRATAGVTASVSSINALNQQARQLTHYAEDQEATLHRLRRENLELESLLASIAELRDKANAAFPAIDQRLRVMLESIEGAMLSALNAQQRLGGDGLDSGKRSGQIRP